MQHFALCNKYIKKQKTSFLAKIAIFFWKPRMHLFLAQTDILHLIKLSTFHQRVLKSPGPTAKMNRTMKFNP